jgi:hypothetical protein
MAKVTGLSGNEIYCLALKHYAAGEIVVGNSVNSMGFLGGLGGRALAIRSYESGRAGMKSRTDFCKNGEQISAN